ELVEAEAGRIGIASVRNPRPEDGMYSSVKAGLASALERFPEASWFGVHPVDIPLVDPACVRALAERAPACRAVCLVPVYEGRRGHPPLLARRFAQRACASDPPRRPARPARGRLRRGACAGERLRRQGHGPARRLRKGAGRAGSLEEVNPPARPVPLRDAFPLLLSLGCCLGMLMLAVRELSGLAEAGPQILLLCL
ncbi:MAG: NTP transferase domain-containing protein, partial [Desulfovibrio sp.]|nr:NTP transferase domain-containing protein [Desulfovibrio sp.]